MPVAAQAHEREAGRVPELGAEGAADVEAVADQGGSRQVGHGAQHVELVAGVGAEVGEDGPSVLGGGQLDGLARERRHRLHRQADVLAAGLQLAHHVAQRVGAVALDDVDRVDAVAGRLAHHLAPAVQDVGVDEAVLERQVAQVVHAGDHHARHPQGDDVAAGHQAGAGVVVAQAVLAAAGGAERGLAGVDRSVAGIGPSQGAVRPQRAGEPGVQHVGVLLEAEVGQLRRQLALRLRVAQAEVDLHLGGRARRGPRDGARLVHREGAALPADRVGDRAELHGHVLAVADALGQVERLPQPGARAARGPDRDLVPPPELSADVPVALLAQPVQVGARVAVVREEGERAPGRRPPIAGHRVDRHLRQARDGRLVGGAAPHGDAAGHVAHAQVPLPRQVRLDGGAGAVGVADLDPVRLDPVQQAGALQVGDHARARLLAVEPGVGAGRAVQGAVGLQDVDQADTVLVALPHLVVVGVVAGCDLHAAGAHLGLGPLVGDQRDLAVQQGQPDQAVGRGHLRQPDQAVQVGLAALAEPGELLLQGRPLALRGALGALGQPLDGAVERRARVGVAGDGGVAEHGLRAGGGHHHVGGLARLGVDHGVAQVPVGAVHGAVADLVVGDRGAQRAVPVDQARAAEHQPVAEQRQEGVAHGARADRVHGEALPVPVAGAAHRPLLLDDALLVTVLPLPDALHQGLAADVVAGLALQLQQAPLDHGLGGDAGVVGAGHPQRVVAQHPVPADQQVLHDVVHGVPHVQGAGDVGQRHHHHVAALAAVGDRAERARGGPALGRLPLGRGVLVAGRQRLVRERRSSFGCRVHVVAGIVAGGSPIRNYGRRRSSSITATRLGSRPP